MYIYICASAVKVRNRTRASLREGVSRLLQGALELVSFLFLSWIKILTASMVRKILTRYIIINPYLSYYQYKDILLLNNS